MADVERERTIMEAVFPEPQAVMDRLVRRLFEQHLQVLSYHVSRGLKLNLTACRCARACRLPDYQLAIAAFASFVLFLVVDRPL